MNQMQIGGNTATSQSACITDEWLTLEQASRRLGVHSTTLRRWANRGAIDVFLTPGGHRRFRRTDVERFEREHHRRRHPMGHEQEWANHAIVQARQSLRHQRWLAVYDDADRQAKRHLGRALMGLVFQYVIRSDEGRDLLLEARVIGGEHARSGLRFGQPLGDLLDAISFFRTTLVEVALLEQPYSIAAQPEASVRLLRRVERLLDEVQAGVVELYMAGRQG